MLPVVGSNLLIFVRYKTFYSQFKTTLIFIEDIIYIQICRIYIGLQLFMNCRAFKRQKWTPPTALRNWFQYPTLFYTKLKKKSRKKMGWPEPIKYKLGPNPLEIMQLEVNSGNFKVVSRNLYMQTYFFPTYKHFSSSFLHEKAYPDLRWRSFRPIGVNIEHW